MINLQYLGLEYYECKILEVLSKEKINLLELSKKSKVPFGKIYSIVKNLKEKGIIEETNSRPKLIYIENFSEVISKLIKEKQSREEKIFENLRGFATDSDKNRKKSTRFFEIGTSVEENKRIQLRTFTESEKEVLQILNIHHKPNSNRESKLIWEKEIESAVKRGVVFKSIYPKKSILPNLIQKLSKGNSSSFNIKRIDTDFTRCDIIDEKKVLLKLVNEDPLLFGGIFFIEDENLAKNLKRIFNKLWNEN